MIVPITNQAHQLMLAGTLCLSRASSNGIPVDLPYCLAEQQRLRKRMSEITESVFSKSTGKYWRSKYGSQASLSAGEQVAHVLFDHLGFKSAKTTAGGKSSSDKDNLSKVDHPLARAVGEYRKCQKMADTFLAGIIRETVNGRIHPNFYLNFVQTYRSSSRDPNFQNLPIRDPEMGQIIRSAFRAPLGWVIFEVDFGALEVRINACINKDARLLRYLRENYDMHRDYAIRCYLLDNPPDDYWEIRDGYGKDVRYSAKNGFVFPAFYGSYWKDISVSLWNNLDSLSLKTPDGGSLKDHLRRQGITSLGRIVKKRGANGQVYEGPEDGTFRSHICELERWFWNQEYPGYAEWKKEFVAAYRRNGYADTPTGFRFSGPMKRNEISNYPAQGSAFHCNLKSMIELERRMTMKKMKGYLSGQIHDSIVGLCPAEELNDILTTAHDVTTSWLPEVWNWLIVPMEIEAETCPPGGTWYEKKKVPFPV